MLLPQKLIFATAVDAMFAVSMVASFEIVYYEYRCTMYELIIVEFCLFGEGNITTFSVKNKKPAEEGISVEGGSFLVVDCFRAQDEPYGG